MRCYFQAPPPLTVGTEDPWVMFWWEEPWGGHVYCKGRFSGQWIPGFWFWLGFSAWIISYWLSSSSQVACVHGTPNRQGGIKAGLACLTEASGWWDERTSSSSNAPECSMISAAPEACPWQRGSTEEAMIHFAVRTNHGKFPGQRTSECSYKKRREMFAWWRWEKLSGHKGAKCHVEDIQVIGCHWLTKLRPLSAGWPCKITKPLWDMNLQHCPVHTGMGHGGKTHVRQVIHLWPDGSGDSRGWALRTETSVSQGKLEKDMESLDNQTQGEIFPPSKFPRNLTFPCVLWHLCLCFLSFLSHSSVFTNPLLCRNNTKTLYITSLTIRQRLLTDF